MRCEKCKTGDLVRIKRNGFLQEKVFAFLGLYPWECIGCRKITMSKQRAMPRAKDAPSHYKPSTPSANLH